MTFDEDRPEEEENEEDEKDGTGLGVLGPEFGRLCLSQR
jgi:hypothetical protein